MRRSPRALLALAALGCAAPAAAQNLSAADVMRLPFDPPAAHVRYGADSLQFGELRLPAGSGLFPVAVLIHGGCWLPQYAASFQNAMATALAKAGVATWNIEYRLPNQPGGGWPNTFRDVADATDYVRTLAKSYRLDTSRVIVVGHSVGAYLAAWDGSRRTLPAGSPLSASNPLRLRGVVALDGLLDVTVYEHGGRGDTPLCGSPVLSSLLGADPASVPERARQLSPMARLPLRVPLVLLYGKGSRFSDGMRPAPDAPVRWATIEDYVAAARAAGDRVESRMLEGVGHFEFVAPGSAAWPVVEEAVLRLLGMPREPDTVSREALQRLQSRLQIQQLRQESNAAIAAHDAARVASFFVEDARVVAGSGGVYEGRAAQQQAFADQFARYKDIVYVRSPETVELSSVAPLAAERGRWVGRWTAPGGPVEMRGSYQAMWRREGDLWLIRSELFVTLECIGAGCPPPQSSRDE